MTVIEHLPADEINRRIAEIVLGWRIHTQRAVSGVFAHNLESIYEIWKDENGDDAAVVSDWSPPTKIGDAWLVVEKLQNRFWLELKSPCSSGGKWFASFAPLGASGWNGQPDFCGTGETAPLAVCRAALAVFAKTEQPDQSSKN